ARPWLCDLSSASSPDSSASGISASIRSHPVQPSRGPMPSIWPRRPATAEVIRLVALDGQTTVSLCIGSSKCGFADAVLDRWNPLLGHRAAMDFLLEHESRTAGQGPHFDDHVAELAVTTRL